MDGDGGAGAFGEAEGGFRGNNFEIDDFIVLEFAEVDGFAEGVAEADHVGEGGTAEGFEIFAGGEEAGDAIAEAVGLVGFVTDEDAEVLEGAEDAEDGGFGDAGTDDGFAEGEGSGARNLFEKAEGALEDRDQVTGLGGGGSGFHSDEGKYGILRRRSRGSIEKRAFLIRNS